MDGGAMRFSSPQDGLDAGVSIVHQQFTLAPELSAAENIFLGRTPRGRFGLVDWKRLYGEARSLLERLDADLDPRRPVKRLGAGERRIVEIARALAVSAKVLILDEPSAVLGPREIEKLFDILRKLKAHGRTVLYISHRLEEIFEIADRVTVLRDGRAVGVYRLDGKVDQAFLVSRMAGREWIERFPKTSSERGPERLSVERLTRRGVFEDVSFQIHAGEIVGMAGLVGSGRTEVCKAVFGALTFDSGAVKVERAAARLRSPREALAAGVAYLPEDRLGEGVIGCRDVGENITLAVVRRFAQRGFLRLGRENEFIDEMMRKTDVRATGRRQTTASLSGGNQQKVALAKWLSTGARVFLLDEPTAGIDVGGKREIHQLIAGLARSGAAVLLVSSDIPEVVSVCSRILVMKRGRIVSRLEGGEATEQEVLSAAL